MADKLKNVALVGAGYWGKNLARNFNALGVLHTLCDANPVTLESYGADFANVNRIDSFEMVLANNEITRVAIATPATTHYRLAKQALAAGKDIFVEKPLCLDADEARELIDIATSSGCILMVGHLLNYHPHVQSLVDLVTSGQLGRLQYITSNRLNLGKVRQEENALWSFAPHDISVILRLAGTLPSEVACYGEAYLTKGVADTTLTHLKFKNGLRAHVYVSWLNPFKEQKLTVVGSDGMAVFNDTKPWNEKLVLYRNYLAWTEGNVPVVGKCDGEAVQVPEGEPLQSECEHFLSCCDSRRAPLTDGAEGLRVLRVLNAAQRSLDCGGEFASPTTDESTEGDFFSHPTAVVDIGASIEAGVKVWHFSHVSGECQIGERTSLGQNVFIAPRVKIGRNVKIQNNVSVYTGTTIEDDAFLGPSCVLTNVNNPRSQISRHGVYEKTHICRGATVGANATIVCGITLGRYSFVAAGAVVKEDVPSYALFAGVPAKQVGWMSRHGHRLQFSEEGLATCPESELRYRLNECDGTFTVSCIDLNEEATLPKELSVGTQEFGTFKNSREN